MQHRSKKRSAVDLRREQLAAQLEHLRSQLASKSRKDFTTDFRHEAWIKQSHDLIDELSAELSALEEPGEYDELPAAVIADEIGLSLAQVRQLIRLGEVEAAGRRAHERVSQRELERLASMGGDEIIKRADESVDVVFGQAVSQLRSGDLLSTETSYRRLQARESCIGNYALATEVAIKLAKGLYEEAERVISFILTEKSYDRAVVSEHLAKFAGEVCFKDGDAWAIISRLLKPLVELSPLPATKSRTNDDLQVTAMYVTSVVVEGIKETVSLSLSVGQRAEFYRGVRERIFTALYAEAYYGTSLKSRMFVNSAKQKLPHYWEPARLMDELSED
jgi:hypothetical protein